MGDDRLKMEETLGTHTGVQARIHKQAQAHPPPCDGQHWHLARDMIRERERGSGGEEDKRGGTWKISATRILLPTAPLFAC